MERSAADRRFQAEVGAGIVDCDIHPSPRTIQDIAQFLPKRWRDHLQEYGTRLRQPLIGAYPYPKSQPALSRLDSWPPEGGPPGSSLSFMREQHLDPNNIAFGMLQPLAPRGMDERNQEFGIHLCRAVNEWQAAAWLDQEPRLRGAITVPGDIAEAAVAEIEYWARDRRFCQVALVTRASEPLGRRRYWPVYEAAEHHGLPIGLHSVGQNGHSTGSGWPSFYYEDHQATAISISSMVSSFVLEGVFDRLPRLNIVAIEGGFTWAPSLAWRLDHYWQRLRSEVPHIKRPPSERMRENVYFTTQPVDEPPDPEDLRHVMEWIGWDRILFSTDYPHWDSDDPRYAFKFAMTPERRKSLFSDNAKKLYGLQ